MMATHGQTNEIAYMLTMIEKKNYSPYIHKYNHILKIQQLKAIGKATVITASRLYVTQTVDNTCARRHGSG